MNRLSLLLAVAVCSLVGCAEPKSVLLKRPQNPETDAAVTQLWAGDIKRVAQDGDWVLSRGYYMTSDAISTVVGGEDISHASIYDGKRGTIIEAVGSGVREIPVEKLLERNAHIIIVRPSGMTEVQRTRSVERARSRVGQPFDNLGMIGFGSEDKVYCSELVWWASQVEQRTGAHERVITPQELMEYGPVVYWSGERDNPQVMELAIEHDRARIATRRVSSR